MTTPDAVALIKLAGGAENALSVVVATIQRDARQAERISIQQERSKKARDSVSVRYVVEARRTSKSIVAAPLPLASPSGSAPSPDLDPISSGDPDPERAIPVLRTTKHEDPDFVEWYRAYPRHENRADASKAWRQVAAERPPLAELLAVIARQKQSGCLVPTVARDGRSVIPHPASWLRGRRWQDEPGQPADRLNGVRRWAAKEGLL